MRILGVIIAGGQSTRMGGAEKALTVLEGVTLVERIASRIGFQVDEVVINANGDPARFAFMPNVVITDLLDVGTPLAGLHTALSFGAEDGYDAVLTVPSDTPLLPLDLVERLKEAGVTNGAAFARSGMRDHYLTGLWTTAMARPLEKLIQQQNLRRVQDFCARAKAENVVWADVPHDPFFNINTPEDLLRAAAIVRGS
jgi:molybdopterin-guanine dinucleotide biosynthesis protein A